MALTKVFVTGGSGYVGSKLVNDLAHSPGFDITVFESQIFGNRLASLTTTGRVKFIKGDITDETAVNEAIRGHDVVVHLAGVVTDELVDMNPDYGRKVNVEGTYIVANAAQQAGVKKFLYASSSSVYGEAAEGEVPPDETVTPLPKTVYAEQKLLGEVAVIAAATDMQVVSVRQATACGPAPRMRLDTVVNIFSKQAYFDHLITPYGGQQYRSNVHVFDAARFYKHLMNWEGKFPSPVYNLTNHNEKVLAIAEYVKNAAITYGLPEPEIAVKDVEDNRSYTLNGDLAKVELGFFANKNINTAAMENFHHFKTKSLDPNDPIYYNNRRMADIVKGA